MSIEITFYLVYGFGTIFRTACKTEEGKVKSYVTTMIRYAWYVF